MKVINNDQQQLVSAIAAMKVILTVCTIGYGVDNSRK